MEGAARVKAVEAVAVEAVAGVGAEVKATAEEGRRNIGVFVW